MRFNMLNRVKLFKLIGIILLIVLVVFWSIHKYSSNAKAGMGMPPTGVKVAAAKLQEWQPQIQATGTLNAEQGIMIKAEASGRVTKIDVESGQKVKAGDILFEINPDVLKAQLAAAQAKSDLSKGDYERALKLFKLNVLSKQDLDTALSNKTADLANVDAVKAQLEQNIVRAPISGKLGLRLFNLGDYIKSEQPLINLQSIDILRVDFSIPAKFAVQVQPGDKVLIRADAFPGKNFNGQVKAKDTAVDVNTRTIAIRAEMSNLEGKLLPGNFVQVTLYAGKPVPYPTIPQIAVMYDPTSTSVYILKDGHAVKKQIEIAQQSSNQVAIRSGLQVGDVVITEGQLKIGEGSPVYAIH